MTSNMENILRTILNEYYKHPDSLNTDVLKENKVWFIDGKKLGKTILKRLPLRHAFSISLQYKLSKKGVHVPKVLPTMDNKLTVRHGDSLFFLTQYQPNLKKLSVKQRIRALASLHQQTQYLQLYPYYSERRYPDRQDFLEYYKRRLQQLKKWEAKVSLLAAQQTMKQMIRQAEQSYSHMTTLDVQSYLKDTAARQTICHGDFHSNNCFLTSQRKLLTIDFDRAYHGPPLDDFRFLRLSLTKNRQFPQRKISILFNQYFIYNPAEKKFKKIYLADTLFPHQFYQQVRKIVHKQKKHTLDQSAAKLAFVAEQEAKVKAFVDSQW